MGFLGGGGGGQSEQPLCIMTRHASCCVFLCTNNFRNSPGLELYRVPKAGRIQREYVRLFRNANLKLNSDSTQIYIHTECDLHSDQCGLKPNTTTLDMSPGRTLKRQSLTVLLYP